jgi:hypothetical protein
MVTGMITPFFLRHTKIERSCSFLENQLAPIFAKQVIGTSSYSQIMVGGSNFGELLGALTVALFTNVVTTPIPWLRLDAVALQLVWILPYISVKKQDVSSAWRIAGCFIPICECFILPANRAIFSSSI